MDGDEDVHVGRNTDEQLYELTIGGDRIGLIAYREHDDRVALLHTEVDESLEGRGLGSRLVQDTLDDLRARGLLVVPLCPFVRAYIRRHPEYEDLVAA